MNSKLVYSTEGLDNFKDKIIKHKKINPSDQNIYLHLERKGGGKIVSVIKGLSHSKIELIELSKVIKKQCGVGGTVKNKEILIQGNFREKIKNILVTKGYNVKFSGG